MGSKVQSTVARKAGIKVKVGYAFGVLPDSIAYNLFYVYFLYFLTDIAGLPAIYGGMISLLVVLWDAITDPIVGYLSDNSRSKYGRRRPFMLAAIVPLLICMILLFSTVNFGPTMSFIYYIVVGIMYWTAYKIYVIPYYALGAELTDDFDDRTNLRGIAGVGMYLAMWMVSSGPMVILDRVLASGGTEEKSWVISGAVMGVIGLVGGLICWRLTKGKELVDMRDFSDKEKDKLIHNYMELFKLKALRRFLWMTLIYNIAFAIALAAFVYIMDNNLDLSPAKQALYWTIYSVLTLSFVPICNVIANVIGKKNAMIGLTGVAILGCFIYYGMGIHSFAMLIGFTIFYNLGNVCYWTVGYSLMYDNAELDEFVNNKRREGAITGFSSFMQKFGSAIGMYTTGSLLSFFGYDGGAGEQTAEALQGIITVNTLVPGMIMVIGTVFIVLYPINKTRYNKLLEILRKREAGEPYRLDDDVKKLF